MAKYSGAIIHPLSSILDLGLAILEPFLGHIDFLRNF